MMDGRMLGRTTVGETEPRGDVLSQLRAGAAKRVITLAGEAGSGKTRAIQTFLRERSRDAFWVAPSEASTTFFAFLHLLVRALAPVARGAEVSFYAMQGRLAAKPQVRAIVAWLEAHVTVPATVVVDNVELLDERDALLREFLVACINECRNLRWIFAGRSLRALPLEAWLPFDLTGVPIVAVDGVAQSPTKLLDALTHEEFELLAAVAPLGSLDPFVVSAVVGDESGRALATLCHDHPPLFEAGSPLRIHRDVRQELLRRAHLLNDSAHRNTIARCGTALEIFARYEELLHLYLRHGETSALEELLARRCLELADSVASDTIERALEQTDVVAPGVLALRAALASRQGRYDLAESLYLQAIALCAQPMRSRLLYAYGCDLLRRNRADAAAIFEQLLVRDAPPMPHQSEVRSALAQAYVLDGRRAEALEQIKFALHVMQAGKSDTATVQTRAAYVYFYAAADLTAAERLASEALACALSTRSYTVAAGAASLLYNVACERDRTAEALAALDLLADCGTKLGNVDVQAYAIVASLEIHVEAGDMDAVARASDALRSFDVAYESVLAADALLLCEAVQLGWRGEFERAYALLLPSLARCMGDDFSALREAQLAFLAAAAGREADARRHLDAAERRLEPLEQHTHKAVRASVFFAVAASAIGERERAKARLEGCARTAARFPRLAQFREAARCFDQRRHGEIDENALLEALLRLRERRGGGFALLLAQFPEPVHAPAFVADLRLHLDEVDAAIDALLLQLEALDPPTAEHSRAVGSWCARIARMLGLDERDVVELQRAGLVHDVGKLRVPTAILTAPRTLTESEWIVVRKHVVAGHEIAEREGILHPYRNAIRLHHERLDGRGYPEGLRAGAIPFQARVVAVADTFNAMIARRPYRPPFTPADALDELYRNRATLFDPEIVHALSRVLGV